jgi:methionyl-tRNA formyltransferase
LIRGEEETGVTVMWMTAELDAGDIFLEERLAILPEDNAGTLAAKLAPRGAALMVEALNRLRRGQGSRQPQLQTGVTFAPPLSAEMRRLNWQLPAPAVAGWIRGLDPKPGAYALWQGRRLKLFGAKVKALTGPSDTPGRVLGILPAGLEIACGQGSIVVQELQMAGHKRLSAPEFLRGQALLEQTLE